MRPWQWWRGQLVSLAVTALFAAAMIALSDRLQGGLPS
jgi:hypothetical protein